MDQRVGLMLRRPSTTMPSPDSAVLQTPAWTNPTLPAILAIPGPGRPLLNCIQTDWNPNRQAKKASATCGTSSEIYRLRDFNLKRGPAIQASFADSPPSSSAANSSPISSAHSNFSAPPPWRKHNADMLTDSEETALGGSRSINDCYAPGRPVECYCPIPQNISANQDWRSLAA